MHQRCHHPLLPVLCGLSTLFGTGLATADIIEVPADQPDVQSAIDVANPGDEILVAAGTFTISTAIDPMGKAVTIRGTLGKAKELLTRLDGAGTSQVFRIRSGETSGTVIADLELARGGGSGFGGCIRVEDGDPTFRNCRITGGSTSIKGGALLAENDSAPVLLDCIIELNASDVAGGGLFADDVSVVRLERCSIEGNEAAVGGGLYINGDATIQLLDSVVCGNLPSQIDGEVVDLGGNVVNDTCGCPLGDSDDDGVDDCTDGCPEDPEKTEPGDCGCGVPDEDSDGDGVPDCNEPPCPADFDGDGEVGGSDLGALFTAWGACSGDCPADFDGDGEVGGSDLGALFTAWGACP